MAGAAIGAAAGLGGGVVGGLLQYKNAQNAQRIAEDQQRRVEEALAKVADPNFDMTQFTPEEYQLVAKYQPQMLSLIDERAPQLVALSDAGRQGQDVQLGALQRLYSIARGGPDAQSQALNAEAMRQAQIQNQGQQASIMDAMARRGGQAGSGLGLAAALSAQQGAAQNASQAGTQAALAQYQNRLNAMMQAGNMGNQVAQNDLNLQGQNANIINAFNQRMAQMQNQNAQYNTGNLNQAQQSNLAAQQSIADRNVGARNDAIAQKNNMQQQQFNNALDKIRIQQGLAGTASQNAMQGAAQQNQAIQGITSGISGAAQYFANDRKKNPYGSQQQNTSDEWGYK